MDQEKNATPAGSEAGAASVSVTPAAKYVAPRVITSSADELRAKAPAVNACGSYVLVDTL
ncbi:hypothetical protein GC173_07340 [bacterium]|nr:hypothetical protein [bacterium]